MGGHGAARCVMEFVNMMEKNPNVIESLDDTALHHTKLRVECDTVRVLQPCTGVRGDGATGGIGGGLTEQVGTHGRNIGG